MYRASNVHYELSERSRGLDTGGIGAMHRLARHVGLVEELDQRVDVGEIPFEETPPRRQNADEAEITRLIALG